jgi:putative ABC transport system permease protein
MSPFTRLYRRLRAVLFPGRNEAELDEEIRFHLEMEAQKHRGLGLSEEPARARALRDFGGVGRAKEESREQRGLPRLEALARDLRIAARSLRRTPGFALVAILTLGLGVGATTAIFSVVHAVLLDPLPFPDPGRLVVPQSVLVGGGDRWAVTYRDFQSWNEAGVFERAAVYQSPELDVTGGAAPIRATVEVVTRDFFTVLGVQPAMGRLFAADDFQGAGTVPVVISDGFWRRMGGARDILGRELRVTGNAGTVVGVLAAGQEWPAGADLWVPRRAPVSADDLMPDNAAYGAIARLKPGITPAATDERLAELALRLERDFPQKRKDVSIAATPFRDWLVGPALTRSLWVLLGAVALVLVIACVNVANLLLARTTRRQHELAVRAALGASQGRLVGQLLTEALLLAIPGGALGVLLAVAGTAVLAGMAPDGVPGIERVGLSAPVLVVALASTLLAVVLAGLAPALSGSKGSAARALIEAGHRTTGTRTTRRLRSTLVIAEVALSLTLLAGAALLLESFRNLQRVAPGVDVEQTVKFEVSLPRATYQGRQQMLSFWDRLVARLQASPGVTGASVASAIPLGGGGFYLGRTIIEAGAPEPPAGAEVGIMWNAVTPGYFETLGQPLLAGRDFTAADDSAGPGVIIVNRAFVEAMFKGAPAVGRRLFGWRDERIAREIVGVVGDVRYAGVSDTLKPIAYVPLGQQPLRSNVVLVRGTAASATLLETARRELAALEPGVAMARPGTMAQVRDDSIAQPRFTAMLLGVFAASAVLLAAIGLSGLVSYTVAQRERELSVRLALGASRAGVQRLVVGQAMGLAGAGVGLGLAGALLLTRVLGALLYGVSPGDPVALALVAALLLLVGLGASWLPARRASRADPLQALKSG